MNKYDLLDLLYEKNGDYFSGETLSEQFGFSRTTIWKSVNQLKADGYDISSITKKGYKLEREKIDVLSKYELLRRLTPHGEYHVEFSEQIGSTNSYALNLAENNATHNTLIVANEQTGGKAKEHGNFFSPPNAGVYMSLILRPKGLKMEDVSYFKGEKIKKFLAVLNAELGESLACVSDSLILVKNKKLGGILTQASIEVESGLIEYLVIGIGLYVNAGDFTKMFKEDYTALDILTQKSFNRADLIAKIVTAISCCP